MITTIRMERSTLMTESGKQVYVHLRIIYARISIRVAVCEILETPKVPSIADMTFLASLAPVNIYATS